mgnify:FL=1
MRKPAARLAGLRPCEDLRPDVEPYNAQREFRYGGFIGNLSSWARYCEVDRETLQRRMREGGATFFEAIQMGPRPVGRPALNDCAEFECGTFAGALKCARKTNVSFANACRACQATLISQMLSLKGSNDEAKRPSCVFVTTQPGNMYWFLIEGEHLSASDVVARFHVKYQALIHFVSNKKSDLSWPGLKTWLARNVLSTDRQPEVYRELPQLPNPGPEAFAAELARLKSEGYQVSKRHCGSEVHGPVLALPTRNQHLLYGFQNRFYTAQELEQLFGLPMNSLRARLRAEPIEAIFQTQFPQDVHPELLGNICAQRGVYFVRERADGPWISLAQWGQENTELSPSGLRYRLLGLKQSLEQARAPKRAPN